MKVKMGIFTILIIVFDQFTKFFIQTNADWHNHIEIIKDFFYITYAKNTGAGWSMFSGHTMLLAVLSIVVIIALCVMFYRTQNNQKVSLFCYSLLISGATGNLIDRLRFGYVRDFLDFYIFGYDFPIFNVADVAVTLGAILLIYIFIKEETTNERV